MSAHAGFSWRSRSPRLLWRTARQLYYACPFYRLVLRGGVPDSVRGTPAETWTGDSPLGHGLIAGVFQFQGQRISVADQPWSLPMPSRPAFDHWQGFGWLRDLRAAGTEDARQTAQRLVSSWIEANSRWKRQTWQPDLIGERLANWFVHYVFLGADRDESFRALLLRSAGEQTRHLLRSYADIPRDCQRFSAARGLIYAGLCFGQRRTLDTGIRFVISDIDQQILPDGGTIERSPQAVATVLRSLVEVRSALQTAHIEVPNAIQGAIDRMAPMLRALRLGDGGLADFNGGTEGDESSINALLAQSGSRAKALTSAPHSGFFRLSSGRSTIIMDSGGAPPPGSDERAHAGFLAFELSVGRDRLIVNCGAFNDLKSDWANALRATAAHSTLTVGDLNAAEVLSGGGIGARPTETGGQRREADGNFLVEAHHDGYRKLTGLVHRRALYLAPDGNDVRGEDCLIGSAGQNFAIRFHLHPRIQASLAQDRSTVLLRLPNGTGWRFRMGEGSLALEDSVYCPDGFTIRRTLQIAVHGTTGDGTTTVRWALRREGTR